MEQNNQTYHLLYNHQGSLRAVVDSNGTIVKELQYDAFGNITLDTNSALHVNFGFAGGLYDTDTKLTRFGYRDYDAQTGKWTAKDPIGFNGGDTNLYGYVLGDPVDFVDPRGKNAGAILVGGAIVVGIAVAVGGAAVMHDAVTTWANEWWWSKEAEKTEAKPLQENCVQEWQQARERCAEELSNSCPAKGLTGGYTDIENCARGLVSERCGGNLIDYGN